MTQTGPQEAGSGPSLRDDHSSTDDLPTPAARSSQTALCFPPSQASFPMTSFLPVQGTLRNQSRSGYSSPRIKLAVHSCFRKLRKAPQAHSQEGGGRMHSLDVQVLPHSAPLPTVGRPPTASQCGWLSSWFCSLRLASQLNFSLCL